ncbi:MAG: hypothetical protein WCE38_10080 [Burkholderiales bacterium]
MTWTPIMTYLAATAGAAGLAYLVCVTWICVRDVRSDRRMQRRRDAQRQVDWTPASSR